jgi:hypothetical protein
VNAYGLAEDRYAILMPPIGVSGRYYQVSDTQIYATADNVDFTEPPDVSFVILREPFTKAVINRSFP